MGSNASLDEDFTSTASAQPNKYLPFGPPHKRSRASTEDDFDFGLHAAHTIVIVENFAAILTLLSIFYHNECKLGIGSQVRRSFIVLELNNRMDSAPGSEESTRHSHQLQLMELHRHLGAQATDNTDGPKLQCVRLFQTKDARAISKKRCVFWHKCWSFKRFFISDERTNGKVSRRY